MLEKFLLLLITEHRGKTIGILAGLILSIMFINIGFWHSVFVIICIGLGFLVGKKLDENYNFDQWLRKWFRDKEL